MREGGGGDAGGEGCGGIDIRWVERERDGSPTHKHHNLKSKPAAKRATVTHLEWHAAKAQ